MLSIIQYHSSILTSITLLWDTTFDLIKPLTLDTLDLEMGHRTPTEPRGFETNPHQASWSRAAAKTSSRCGWRDSPPHLNVRICLWGSYLKVLIFYLILTKVTYLITINSHEYFNRMPPSDQQVALPKFSSTWVPNKKFRYCLKIMLLLLQSHRDIKPRRLYIGQLQNAVLKI
jgi:hypothetical protein